MPLQGPKQATAFPPGKQYGFFFDQGRCTSCMNCMLACQMWNNLPMSTPENATGKWMRVYQWEEGSFPLPRIFVVAVPCYHCEDPKCVDVANGALYKEPKYGAVLLDPAKAKSHCLDLRKANDICPYGAIVFDSDDPANATASKCTMCIDRLEQGMAPVCVLACDTKCWEFGPFDEIQSKYGTLKTLPQMPDPNLVKPACVFKAQLPRKNIVPYDANKALALWKERGPNAMTGEWPNPFEVCPVNAPPVFDNVADVMDPNKAIVGRQSLVLKHKNNASLDYHTRVDE